ncbi:MAG: apolipoprotein N-acyltransferase, partial [Myxococcota bacterium]
GVAEAEARLGLRPTWTLMALWPAVELIFPALFPHSVAYALHRLIWLTQIVEITGVLGLTVLIAAVSGAIYETGRARGRSPFTWPIAPLAVAAALAATMTLFGALRLPAIDRKVSQTLRLKVGLVQTNLGEQAVRGPKMPYIARHQQMTEQLVARHPSLDLVVWPESSYSRLLPRPLSGFDLKARVLPTVDVPLLFGATTFTPATETERHKLFNSAILMAADGGVRGRFDKIELLAYGETVPLLEVFPALRRWLPARMLHRGQRYEHLTLDDVTLLPMVCYEDILPAFVRRMWSEAGPADVLINITNDSWYGDSHEPWIHLVIASFRAIETRRALIRSTNTGISAVVDPAGRIVARTGQWTEETLVYEVPLMTDGRSTLFMRWGPVIGWLALWGCVAALSVSLRRRGALLFVLLPASVGCGGVSIPYPLQAVTSRPEPRHPLRVAVLPFVDTRRADERAGGSDRFMYRGTEYRGTVMDDLAGVPAHHVTEVFARHLARSRSFAQLILVLDAAQAPQADLLLDGRILRLRGYVEAAPPEEQQPPMHKVLAEVVFEDLRLRTPDGRVVLQSDAGWSIFQSRPRPLKKADPWAIMSEAMRVAIDDFVALIDKADLSGGYEVRSRVQLFEGTRTSTESGPFAGLAADAPYGWRFERGPAAAPIGWRGEAKCKSAALIRRQTRRFHRVLGPYTPRVRLWACPLDAVFQFDARTAFPAELLGRTDNHRYFWWTLGKTNWPNADAQLRRRWALRVPPSRYIFEVGRPPPPTRAPRNQRLEESVRTPLVPGFSSTTSDNE